METWAGRKSKSLSLESVIDYIFDEILLIVTPGLGDQEI